MKKLISFILALSLYACNSAPVDVPETAPGVDDRWVYEIEKSGEITVTGCSTTEYTAVMPPYIKGKKVTTVIGKDYFITPNLVVADTVEHLYTYKGKFSGAETLTLGKNVRDFAEEKNTEFDNEYLFSENPKNLKAINVDPENPYLTSVDGVLYDKQMKTLIRYPVAREGESFTLPETVEKIGISAFAQTKLKEVKLNKNLREIGDWAFSNSAITGIQFNEHLQKIGIFAFEKTGIQEVNLNRDLEEIGAAAFDSCSRLSKVKFNKKVRSVGVWAFADTALDKSNLNPELYIDDVLIGYYEYPKKHPKKIKVKKGTRVIADSAISGFSYGHNAYSSRDVVEEIELPSSVRHIGHHAFASTKLKKINMPKKIRSVGADAFADTPYMEAKLKTSEDGLVYCGPVLLGSAKNNYPKNVVVKAGTRVIADYDSPYDYEEYKHRLIIEASGPEYSLAENGCKYLESLKLPKSLVTIGSKRFYGAKKLKKLTIPKSVTMIGEDAFANTKTKIKTYKNSYAREYVKANGL